MLVDFWFNHFNVFAGKGRTAVYLPDYEREAIRPHVWGSFRELLGATAKSPAMLFYLDNWQSVGPRSMVATGQRPFGGNMRRMGRMRRQQRPQQPQQQNQQQDQQQDLNGLY